MFQKSPPPHVGGYEWEVREEGEIAASRHVLVNPLTLTLSPSEGERETFACVCRPSHGPFSRFWRSPLQFFFAVALAFVLTNLFAAEPDASSKARTAPHFSVRWVPAMPDTNKFVVEVSCTNAAALAQLRPLDWKPEQWQRLLSVYAEQGDLITDIGLPSMLGAYQVKAGVLRFEPRFPLAPGVRYRAVFHPDELPGEHMAGGGLISAVFHAPTLRANPTTFVSQVYPSAELLPENLLKFYVHFSAPMRRGHIYAHIHLVDDAGKAVELPFLEIDEELWNPEMTRLTLFIDPGRIKRGVRPLEEVGPALEEGKRYTLVIDKAWKDSTGTRLRETFRKAFKVGPPDRTPPDPAHWKIGPPKSGTREQLTINFPEPMDHALAQRVIRVTTAQSGELVEGSTALADQERRWTFAPIRPWRRASYQVVVQTTIEDLAGNNIGKPFEVDLFEGVQRRLTNATVNLPFEIR